MPGYRAFACGHGGLEYVQGPRMCGKREPRPAMVGLFAAAETVALRTAKATKGVPQKSELAIAQTCGFWGTTYLLHS